MEACQMRVVSLFPEVIYDPLYVLNQETALKRQLVDKVRVSLADNPV